jgi:AAA15 family ATPase/GTPase
MLIRFAVSNHRSLRDRQELSFVASSLHGSDDGMIECRHVPGGSLLPAIVICGANASGKTNLVRAIGWMRSAVLHSHSRGEPDDGISRTPFRLDSTTAECTSHFAVDFILDDIRYHYGFEATDTAFVSEWLLAYPNEKRQILFEREGMKFHFGRNLKGRNQVISELTRPNSLFLSAAAQNAHEELTKIREFFQNINIGGLDEVGLAEALLKTPTNPRLIGLLRAAGTGVVDYKAEEQTDSGPRIKEFREGLSVLLSGLLARTDVALPMNDKMIRLKLAHQTATSDPVYFDLAEESQGTRWLLRLVVPILQALDAGSVMVIDELDSSLHTLACELVLGLFASRRTNPKGAQLIVTTHDTNLLRFQPLRRDQIWFAEKDRGGATHIYPLTDFRTRETDNIERGYLQGRFGAVPFSGSVAEILASI